jgi:hypothetical protein
MAYSPAINTGTGKAFPSRVDNSERGAHRPEQLEIVCPFVASLAPT